MQANVRAVQTHAGYISEGLRLPQAPIRGLWTRNERCFANLTVTHELGAKKSRFVPLNGSSLDEAKADYARLLTERADERLRPLGQVPTLAEYLETRYLPALESSGKRIKSVLKDRTQLARWRAEIGDVHLNKLNPGHLDRVLIKLTAEGLSGIPSCPTLGENLDQVACADASIVVAVGSTATAFSRW